MRILSVTPPINNTLGNSTIRLTGRGLSRVVAVRLDGVYVSEFYRFNSRSITFLLPPTSAGTHEIVCVGKKGKQARASAQTVDSAPNSPVITSIHPAVDYYGDPCLPPSHYRSRCITYHGHNLANVTQMWMDGVQLKHRVIDAQTVVAKQRSQRSGARSSSTLIRARDDVTGINSPANQVAAAFHGIPGGALIHASDHVVTTATQASPVQQLLAVQKVQKVHKARCNKRELNGLIVTRPPPNPNASACQ
jgi:hypothetical protein